MSPVRGRKPSIDLVGDGMTALASMMTSCAPGISVVGIDNGYGAACAAHRILGLRNR